jgi:hypothetical protein
MVRRRVGEGKNRGVDGGQERRTAPAAGAPASRAEEQWRQEEEGGRTEPGIILQYQRKIGTLLKRTCNF